MQVKDSTGTESRWSSQRRCFWRCSSKRKTSSKLTHPYIPGTQSLWSSQRRRAERWSRGSRRPLSWSSNPSCRHSVGSPVFESLCCFFLHFLCHSCVTLNICCFSIFITTSILYLAPSALLMLKETSAEDATTAGAGSGLPCLILNDHHGDWITLNTLII